MKFLSSFTLFEFTDRINLKIVINPVKKRFTDPKD